MLAELETDGLSDPALATLARVRAGFEARQVPMVAQIVRLIKDISDRGDRLSVNDLVEAISGEPTTMSRIISSAGSVNYNTRGVEVNSIHHAVSIIGFERVRNLAISLLLLESAQSPATAQNNRELAGQALVSGLIAAELGRRSLPVDPDIAFVCSALRNYGRMLAATFLPDEYADCLRLAFHGNSAEAFQKTFGLSSLELGRLMLSELQLPAGITATFVNLSEEERRHALGNPVTALCAAGEFGLRMAEIIQTPDLTNESFDWRVEALCREYEPAFHLSNHSSRAVLAQVVGVLDSFRSRNGQPVGSVTLFRRLDCIAHERPFPKPADPAPKPKAPPAPAPAPLEPANEFVVGVDEVVLIRPKPQDIGNFEI